MIMVSYYFIQSIIVDFIFNLSGVHEKKVTLSVKGGAVVDPESGRTIFDSHFNMHDS